MCAHKPVSGRSARSPKRALRAPGAERSGWGLRRAAQALAALALGAASATALATLVPAGSSALLSGTTAAADPSLAGTVLQDVVSPFTIDLGSGSTLNGYVQDRVVRESGSGTLDFYYRLFNGTDTDGCMLSSDGSIGVAQRSGYAGYSTDVNYRTDGLGSVAPSGASRTAGGDGVLFGFLSNPIAPGQTSLFFFVHTQATAYNDLGTGTLIGFNAQGGFGQTQFMTFEPAPVPISPAVWLFASGLLGLLGVAWRSRTKRFA
ncbi:MAG: hypothetical protein M0Z84_01930 [Gammaproteobacteria bacterium]|nr:hypothetical protein [Gammaproteobacteria bacterium]